MVIDAGTLQVKTQIDERGFDKGIEDIRRKARRFKINIEIDERDFQQRARRAYRGVESGAGDAGRGAGRAFANNFFQFTERDLLSVRGGFFGRIGGEIANRTVVGFSRAFRAGVRGAITNLFNFDDRRSQLFTLGVDENAIAEQTTDLNAALGTQIKQVEALEIAYSLISAGISDYEKRTEALTQAIKLTVGGSTDSTVAVELLTKAYANFGQSFEEIADTVSAGVIEGQFDLQGFARAFPNVSQAAGNLGLTVQETTAFVAGLSQETKNVSTAVTQAKNALVALEKDGFKITDTGLSGLIEKLKSLGPEGLAGITGNQNAQNGLKFLVANAERFEDILGRINNASGTADRNFERLGRNLNNTFGTTGNLLGSIQEELLQNITPALTGIGDFVNKILERIRDAIDESNEGATVAEKINSLFGSAGDLAEEIGDQIARLAQDALEAANQQAEQFLEYLQQNPGEIANATQSAASLTIQLGEAVKSAASLLGLLQRINGFRFGGQNRRDREEEFRNFTQQQESFGQSLRETFPVGAGLFNRLTGNASEPARQFGSTPAGGFAQFRAAEAEQLRREKESLEAELSKDPIEIPVVPVTGGATGGGGGGVGRSGRDTAAREAERLAELAARELERQLEINNRIRERASLSSQILGLDLRILEAETRGDEILASQLEYQRDIVEAQQRTDQLLRDIVNDPLARAAVLREQELEQAIALENLTQRQIELQQQAITEQVRAVQEFERNYRQSVQRQETTTLSFQDEITGGYERLTSGLVTGLVRGENAFERFGDVALSVLDQILQKLLLQPFLNLFGGQAVAAPASPFKILFNQPAGATGFPRAPLLPGFAGGVKNFSGGLAVVGEQGPEVVNLPHGSDVLPVSGNISQQMTVRFVNSDNEEVPARRGADGSLEIELDRLVTNIASSNSSLFGRFLNNRGVSRGLERR